MHPPAFQPSQLLSDWPDCYLELRCPNCRSATIFPVRLLIKKRGNQSFHDLLQRLACKRCQARPAPVYLCASQHRRPAIGMSPDWAVELVTAPAGAPGAGPMKGGRQQGEVDVGML